MFPVSEKMISRKWILRKEILLFVVLTAFVTVMMFYVFRDQFYALEHESD